MKKLCFLLAILFFVASLFAQAPEKMTYQAVVRDNNNHALANVNVSVRISILQGSATGTVLYSETHVVCTNVHGLMTINIGDGTIETGIFSAIDWANGPYFLKTETDPNGGSSYSIESTQQLLSVPYALYANQAGNGFSGDFNDLTNKPTIPTVPTNVSSFTNDAGYITSSAVPTNVSQLNNDANYITSSAIPTNVSSFTNDAGYLTSYTETQILRISNDTIYLTGGSFVKLPAGFDGNYNSLTNKPTIPTVPTNVSSFTNDAGYITSSAVPTNVSQLNNDANYITSSAIPTNVSSFTNDAGYLTSYTETQILRISNDTIYLTGGSFAKLPAGFDGDYNSLTNKPNLFSGNYNDLTDKPNLSNVATSGNYNDLSNTPTIPTVPTNVGAFTNDAGYITSSAVPTNVSQLNNDANYITSTAIPTQVSTFTNDAGYLTSYTETQILRISNDSIFLTGGSFVKLPAGFDGDYNSLTNRPNIPTVPTNVSAFNNDAGYITSAAIPTNVSTLNNDAGYITNAAIPTNVSTFNNDAGYISNLQCDSANFCSIINTLNQLTAKVNLLRDSLDQLLQNRAILTIHIPNVAVSSVDNLTGHNATVTAIVSSDGGADVTSRGICYSINNNPTIADIHISEGSGIGNFIITLANLQSGSTYYVRAYAINSAGTSYSEQVSFTTISDTPTDALSCPGTPTVTDHEGNVYSTVLIGNQCWMRENMRCTSSPSTGTFILETDANNLSTTGKKAYYVNGVSSNTAVYGLLYNWCAAMDTFNTTKGETSTNSDWRLSPDIIYTSQHRGICPIGWHIPSDSEWTQLSDYVSSIMQYRCNGNISEIAKALASTTNWSNSSQSCNIGNTSNTNNATGFSAVSAGKNFYGYSSFRERAYFWTSLQKNYYQGYTRYLSYDNAVMVNSDYSKSEALSVRCLRDENIPTPPINPDTTITTPPVISIESQSNPDGACNPNILAPTFTVSDACTSSATISVTTNGPQGSSCDKTQTWTANYTSPCGLSATPVSVTYTWTESSMPTLAIASQNDPNGANNPTIIAPTFSVSDACNPNATADVTTTGPQGSDNNKTQTWTANYTNACGESASPVSVTYNWTEETPSVTEINVPASDSSSISSCDLWIYDNGGPTENYTNSNNGYLIIHPSNADGLVYIDQGTYNTENNFDRIYIYDGDGINGTLLSTLQGTGSITSSIISSTGPLTIQFTSDGSYQKTGFSLHSSCYSSHPSYPIVTTTAITHITTTFAVSGGTITDDGGGIITARGICWSTAHNPTLNDAHVISSNGTASYSSLLSGLSASTTYYVRAFATNSTGTAYGEEITFTTSSIDTLADEQSCPGLPFLTDYDGNIYNTVLIGSQCWMKENLRTTHYSDGTFLTLESHRAIPHLANGNTAPDSVYKYGYLYDINAALRNAAFSNNIPSGVQGVCPDGWHLPSNGEWYILRDYVSSCSSCTCNNNTSYIAKALAAATPTWPLTNENNGCLPGTNWVSNNTSGFSIYPAGTTNSSGEEIGSLSYMLTASASAGWTLHKYNENFYETSLNYIERYSVRCIYNDTFPTHPIQPDTTITTPPVISIESQSNPEGACNPNIVAPTFTVSDACTPNATISVTTNGPQGSSCDKTQTWTANYTSTCSLSATPVSVTYTWTESSIPTLSVASQNNPNGANNPTIIAPTFSVSDACNPNATADVTTTGPQGSDNNKTQTWTANYTNACGQSASPVSVTYNWTEINTPITTPPTIGNTNVSNITTSSATINANITSDGNATITTRGVCWSTYSNPTLADNHTTDGSGTGSFIITLTNLQAGTTYHVRVYATNSEGTTYGDDITFTTSTSGGGGSTGTNQAPTCSITNLTNGEMILYTDTIVINATATDSDNNVSYIRLYWDDVLINYQIGAQASFILPTHDINGGLHTIRVVAVDSQGESGMSEIVIDYVVNYIKQGSNVIKLARANCIITYETFSGPPYYRCSRVIRFYPENSTSPSFFIVSVTGTQLTTINTGTWVYSCESCGWNYLTNSYMSYHLLGTYHSSSLIYFNVDTEDTDFIIDATIDSNTTMHYKGSISITTSNG